MMFLCLALHQMVASVSEEQCMKMPVYSCREEHCDKDWCEKFDAAAGDTCFWDVEDNICKSTTTEAPEATDEGEAFP